VSVVSIEPCDLLEDGIFIPNVISPNGDGINDVLSMYFGFDIEVVRLQGAVYDRWSNLLFASEDIPFTWDGRRNGELMNPGVYVYTFLVNYVVDGRSVQERISGDVTVVR
jgi:gliding motility-associated-like protein